MTENSFEAIVFQVPKPSIGLVTMRIPGCLNALSLERVDELYRLFDRLDKDSDVRVIVITGAGRGFCAGADLSDERLLPPSMRG